MYYHFHQSPITLKFKIQNFTAGLKKKVKWHFPLLLNSQCLSALILSRNYYKVHALPHGAFNKMLQTGFQVCEGNLNP